jgi:hypothetical protein
LKLVGQVYLRMPPTRLRFENGSELTTSVLVTTASGLSRDAYLLKQPADTRSQISAEATAARVAEARTLELSEICILPSCSIVCLTFRTPCRNGLPVWLGQLGNIPHSPILDAFDHLDNSRRSWPVPRPVLFWHKLEDRGAPHPSYLLQKRAGRDFSRLPRWKTREVSTRPHLSAEVGRREKILTCL